MLNLFKNVCKWFIHGKNVHVQPYYLRSLETSKTMLLTLEREERQKRCHDYKAITGEGVAKGVLDCYGAEERRGLIHPSAEFLVGAAQHA